MFDIKEIKNISEVEELYCRLQGKKQELPVFMYESEEFIPMSFSYLKNDRINGLAFGVRNEKNSTFYLHYLRVTDSATDIVDIKHFTEQLIKTLKVDFGLEKVIIFLEQMDYEVPPYAKLVESIDGCTIERIDYLRQVGIETDKFDHFRSYVWYRPNVVLERGYKIIKICDYPDDWQKELIEKEKNKDLPEDYLSPGMWEESWEYDKNTSYVLVKEGNDRPSGWIVTEKISDDIVKLRRFYIYKEERRIWMGPSFSTWVLEDISHKYKQFRFEVEKGNGQMERFVSSFCLPITTFNYIKCNLIIKIH